mgnify:CR=1 FL=1
MNVRLIAFTQPVEGIGIENLNDFVAYVARVSNPANQLNTETSARLVDYLKKQNHWSPFEMASIVMEIKTTRDIAHQILRHRSFSFQEFSQRYANVIAEPVIRESRLQDKKNRQNSLENSNAELENEWVRRQVSVANLSTETYGWALEQGIAKEVARAVLPEGMTETTLYMSGTIRSWIHYCELRCTLGTQKEHREVAMECRGILEGLLSK